MQARMEPGSGKVLLLEAGRPILAYRHQPHTPWSSLDGIAPGNRIYARPRCDYIHPLYGPRGEILTCDGPNDHPHHRGIYWAWPEVEQDGRRGDLHALQHLLAVPEGDARLRQGPGSCSLEATHLWRWEDGTSIVRENVRILAHRATDAGRFVDLELRFQALVPGVTLARRDTRLYGGLNLRLDPPSGQGIHTHTDPVPDPATPEGSLRSWSDLRGSFQGGPAAGLAVLPHRDNPGHPPDWIQYPDLGWCQPAFPPTGTRHPLSVAGPPLVLRYRLWIHEGPTPSPAAFVQAWDDYHRQPRSPSP